MGNLFKFAFGVVAVAIAINVAVGLIEAVAGTLVVIVAVIGGMILLGLAVRLWWVWHQSNRW